MNDLEARGAKPLAHQIQLFDNEEFGQVSHGSIKIRRLTQSLGKWKRPTQASFSNTEGKLSNTSVAC
jgi:hypothetical protein